jgi:hypothetical protein
MYISLAKDLFLISRHRQHKSHLTYIKVYDFQYSVWNVQDTLLNEHFTCAANILTCSRCIGSQFNMIDTGNKCLFWPLWGHEWQLQHIIWSGISAIPRNRRKSFKVAGTYNLGKYFLPYFAGNS